MDTLELNILKQPPLTLDQWQSQRTVLRRVLWDRLGDLPPLFTPPAVILSRVEHDEYVVEKFMFENGAGAQVYGCLVLPKRGEGPFPVVIYHHVHGGKYEIGKEELFQERVPGMIPALELIRAGFAVFAVDAYSFGERQNQGPAGTDEAGRETEHALFKTFLWWGSSLWGMMVRDDLLALNYLVTRTEIDTSRIGVVGMSLGASRTTWMAALDDRPKVVIPIAQMTRYQDFAEAGRMNGHSVYYYVPGVLKSGLEMDHLAALVAPRTQAVLIGDADPLSPIVGVRRVQTYAERIYKLYEAEDQLDFVIEPDVAHEFTPSMFTAMMETLKRHL